MTYTKEKFLNTIFNVEGGYVNDAKDSGGETNYGITEAVARQNGYIGNMRNLPRELASKIYADKYWNALSLDSVDAISSMVALKLADIAVNCGTGRAGEFLQRALNVLNNAGIKHPDIAVDGQVGGGTLSALKAFYRDRGDKGMDVMHKMLNAMQGAFYIGLAEKREKDESFIFGWFNNRIS